MSDLYKGRKTVIATKHHKEKVIAPLLETELGMNCFVPENFDTDILGTFSGEIERTEDPVTTLRKKCVMALDLCGCDLAVGNEGSFGSHPSIPFACADDEFVMLIDKKNGIEIIERELSLDTNFNGSEITAGDELLEFAAKVNFPSHGIILKKSKNDFSTVLKDMNTLEELIKNYNQIKGPNGNAYAETDMRAMRNPTRMGVIEKAALKLVARIKSACPDCGTPGFGVADAKKGLPCELCNFPTRSVISHIYRCQKCHFYKEQLYPFGKMKENPQYCDFCNP